jgi:hypothetical protein
MFNIYVVPLVLPMSESDFARTPLVTLKGADYSHFDARYGSPRKITK